LTEEFFFRLCGNKKTELITVLNALKSFDPAIILNIAKFIKMIGERLEMKGNRYKCGDLKRNYS